MNAQQKRKIRAAFEVVNIICDEVSETMPVRQALAFLSVAIRQMEDGEADLRDVAKDIGANSAVTSRDLLTLGKKGRNDRPGYGLVAIKEDYTDLRRRPYVLTKDGDKVISNIVEAL